MSIEYCDYLIAPTPSTAAWTDAIRKEIAHQFKSAAADIGELEKKRNKLYEERNKLYEEQLQLQCELQKYPILEQPGSTLDSKSSTIESQSTTRTSVVATFSMSDSTPSTSTSTSTFTSTLPLIESPLSVSKCISSSSSASPSSSSSEIPSHVPPILKTVRVLFAHNGTVSLKHVRDIVQELIRSTLELRGIQIELAEDKEECPIRCMIMQQPAGRKKAQEEEIQACFRELPHAPQSLCLLCVVPRDEDARLPYLLGQGIDVQFVQCGALAVVPEHTIVTFLSILP